MKRDGGILLSGVLAAYLSQACATQKDPESCHRCDRPIAVDFQVLGLGAPVGVTGAYVTHYRSERWTHEAGIGHGLFGTHVTANALWYPQPQKLRFFRFGISYSDGVEQRTAGSAQIQDALWLNLALGLIVQKPSGWRYSFDLGLTVPAVDEMARKRKEGDALPGRGVSGTGVDFRRGDIIPTFTLLRVGYAL